MYLAFSTSTTSNDFDKAVDRTRQVLADNGFSVLTEVDVQAAVRPLGKEMERYLILGACNADTMLRAVSAEKQIGVLLPCNVVVREDPEDRAIVHIEAVNPQLLVRVTENPALVPLVEQVTESLLTTIDTLADELR